MTAILSAIAGISAVVGGFVYLVKIGFFEFHKTPDQQDQDIQKQVSDAQSQAEQSGRPV